MILDSTGRLASFRDRQFSQSDAELLRHYKATFLVRHGYKEKLWCQKCSEIGQEEGVRAFVTDQKIGMTCRCSARHYNGQTY